jgi:histidine ammonia-lyase
MLNKNVVPIIPEQGSVGASGDLVPLSHLALVLIGEGEAFYDGKRMSGAEAMKKAGIMPIELVEKEGLALINGTQMMCALGIVALKHAEALLKDGQIAASMSAEALKGTDQAFRAEIHKVRPHKGQIAVAQNMWEMTRGSEIIASHKDCPKVQDAYSIRCIPQVLGASKDAIAYVRGVLETEINSATDNPLIFNFGAISGGNFHGQPLALALDFLGIAVAEIADISERRIARIVDPKLSGLPAFLAENSGLNSGLMIPQYTAAALVSENKVLAHPASVDSIPTSANIEDHVSMGSIAARKALKIIENAENVVGIEYLCALQGLTFHKMKAGKGTQAARECLQKQVAPITEDRYYVPDMQKIREMMIDGVIIKAVEKKIGKLK